MKTTKSYYPKGEVPKEWYLVDLKGKVLGKAASKMASVLRGKHKPQFTPSADTGDFVVAINAKEVVLTGKKWDDKVYYRHSGRMGGLKQQTARELIKKNAAELIQTAVKGMLPRGPLGRRQLKKLKVYAGAEQPHKAQKLRELIV